MTRVQIKRVYEDMKSGEGQRAFVERMWPRGISKQDERVGQWFKEVAPTDELRRWFHETCDFANFSRKYRKELEEHQESKEALQELKSLATDSESIILVYASKDEHHNSATILKDVLDSEF